MVPGQPIGRRTGCSACCSDGRCRERGSERARLALNGSPKFEFQPPELSSEAENEWTQLREIIRLHNDEFWLGVACVDDSRAEVVLRERTRALLRGGGQRFEPHVARRATDLQSTAEVALRTPVIDARRPLVWILGVGGVDGDAWRAQWLSLLGLLNERRDTLPLTFPGGIMLAGPPDLNLWLREHAADLWSIRNLVLRLRSAPSDVMVGQRSEPSPTGVTLPFRREPEGVIAARCPEADPSLREASGLAASGQTAAAVQVLLEAVSGSPGPNCEALLFGALSDVEANNDQPASLDHAVRALTANVFLGFGRRVALLERVRDLGVDVGRDDVARSSATRLVELFETRSKDDRRSWARLLLVATSALGDIATAQGDLTSARTAYTQSHDLAVELRALLGDTPQTLRDLSFSLDKVGDAATAQGDLTSARTAYTQSHDLAKRVAKVLGTPPALRDLAYTARALLDSLEQDDPRREELAQLLATQADDTAAAPTTPG